MEAAGGRSAVFLPFQSAEICEICGQTPVPADDPSRRSQGRSCGALPLANPPGGTPLFAPTPRRHLRKPAACVQVSGGLHDHPALPRRRPHRLPVSARRAPRAGRTHRTGPRPGRARRGHRLGRAAARLGERGRHPHPGPARAGRRVFHPAPCCLPHFHGGQRHGDGDGLLSRQQRGDRQPRVPARDRPAPAGGHRIARDDPPRATG